MKNLVLVLGLVFSSLFISCGVTTEEMTTEKFITLVKTNSDYRDNFLTEEMMNHETFRVERVDIVKDSLGTDRVAIIHHLTPRYEYDYKTNKYTYRRRSDVLASIALIDENGKYTSVGVFPNSYEYKYEKLEWYYELQTMAKSTSMLGDIVLDMVNVDGLDLSNAKNIGFFRGRGKWVLAVEGKQARNSNRNFEIEVENNNWYYEK